MGQVGKWIDCHPSSSPEKQTCVHVCVLRCFLCAFFEGVGGGGGVSSSMRASNKNKNNWLVLIAEGEKINLESTALCGYFGLFLSSRASAVVYH